MISAHLLHSRLCFRKDFDVMIVIIRQLWASSLLLGLHLLVDLDGLDVLVALESLDRVLGELDTANIESVKCSSQHQHYRRRNIRKALDEVVLVGDLAALVLGVLLGGSDLLGGSTVLAGDLFEGVSPGILKHPVEEESRHRRGRDGSDRGVHTM